MRIALGNQKGGVGKTTLSLLICNYISTVLKQKIVAVDLDPQLSLYYKWQSDKNLYVDNAPNYDVLKIPEEYSKLYELLQIIDESDNILIDLPGYMVNNDNVGVFNNIDLLIVPFNYTAVDVESTLLYVKVIHQVNPNLKICFIPNKVKTGAKYELLEGVNEVLANYGWLAPALNHYVDYERVTVNNIPTKIKGQLLFCLSKVLEYGKGSN
ncbi:MAG: ParA family protein [Flavobacteriales bacterium]|jgi:chromosome partitioning protein